jgi:DNA modification methylase
MPPPRLRNDIMPRLELVDVPVSELQRPSRAVRRREQAHVREVTNAIAAHGFRVPLLIGANNQIIDGVARLEAAILLGLSSVPCVRTDCSSEIQLRLLRLSVNRLGEKGGCDLDELRIEFEELISLGANVEDSGFAMVEVDQIVIGGEAEAVEKGPLEPEPNVMAISRAGDIFQLGLHRVICGDARDPEVLARLMDGDAPVRFVFTDVPYNVKIAGHVTGGDHREFAMASGEMSDEEYLEFNIAWIGIAIAYLRDGGLFATFIDWRGLSSIEAAAAKHRLEFINLIVWAKTNAGMGSLYRSQHELLPLFKQGDAPHINNIELGKKGRWRSNLWTYPGASSLGSEARQGLRDHPTVKPTAMLQDALLDVTERGDIVLDPFLGSGSTLIAADKTARVCRGVELDPRYVDVIVRRFEAVTRKSAILVETGETFQEMAARRAAESAHSAAEAAILPA